MCVVMCIVVCVCVCNVSRMIAHVKADAPHPPPRPHRIVLCFTVLHYTTLTSCPHHP